MCDYQIDCATKEEWAARAWAAEQRAYKLAVAIMGGEDAPGYADSIDADVLADQLRKERMQASAWTDACVKAALATARRDALEEAAATTTAFLLELGNSIPAVEHTDIDALIIAADRIRALIAQEEAEG